MNEQQHEPTAAAAVRSTSLQSPSPSLSTTSSSNSTMIHTFIFLRTLANPLYAPWIGLVVRLVLAILLPSLLDDGRWIPGVSYTDIDFYVFSDAAAYILVADGKNDNGSGDSGSPYDRHTYRYTPFLAALLARLPNVEMGRYLFCLADATCGWIVLKLRQEERTQRKRKQVQQEQEGQEQEERKDNEIFSSLMDATWWLYNPLAINICTRGSSESLMVLLPVLATYWIATRGGSVCGGATSPSSSSSSTMWLLCASAISAGLIHGVAVHSKLYPVIYTGSYMAYFATTTTTLPTTPSTTNFPWMEPMKLIRLIRLWIRRFFFTPPFAPLVFLMSATLSFLGTTYVAVQWYGPRALQEGLLYHFGRLDHRHNYSMYWYWIYLARARDVTATLNASSSTWLSLSAMGQWLLVPQAILLIYSSLGLAPRHLALALFTQTFLFVTHNKVITAQYFTWYLCLLPLCWTATLTTGGDNNDENNHQANDNSSKTRAQQQQKQQQRHRRMMIALILLLVSIVMWLLSAYCLEMRGMAVHRFVWMASVLYFFANVNVLGALLAYFEVTTTTTKNNEYVTHTIMSRAILTSKQKTK